MNKTDLSIFKNPEYYPGSFIKRILWFVTGRIFINTYFPFPQYLKIFILKIYGAKLGKGIVIKPKVNIKYPWFLTIGNYTWIGEQVWIDNVGEVKIGSNVCISQGALLLCGNHNYKKSSFDSIIGEIIIEDGVWIGARSVICFNVTCESHSLLTVNSVAIKDLKSNSIYTGNPAVKVRERIIEG